MVFLTGLHKESICMNYALFDVEQSMCLLHGTVNRIAQGDSSLVVKKGGSIWTTQVQVPNCAAGVAVAIDSLTAEDHQVIESPREIEAVGHRVAHGGEKFKNPVIIDEKVIDDIRHCISLAPLHNPYNLIAIETSKEILSTAPHVAVFDSCFHLSLPDYAFIYGIPYELYIKYGIRRYGFQGLSHQSVAEKAGMMLSRPLGDLRLITCHLGDGASITAIKNGKAVDTSMGFTPAEGLLMATRAGDMDVSIIPYIMERNGSNLREIKALINEKGGMLGISSISGDIKDILAAMEDGSYRARLAFNVFCYRLKKYIASYMGVLGGADAVVFTGNTGETVPQVRSAALNGLEFIGIVPDEEKNRAAVAGEHDISAAESRVKIFTTPSGEEMVIAKETAKLVNKK